MKREGEAVVEEEEGGGESGGGGGGGGLTLFDATGNSKQPFI